MARFKVGDKVLVAVPHGKLSPHNYFDAKHGNGPFAIRHIQEPPRYNYTRYALNIPGYKDAWYLEDNEVCAFDTSEQTEEARISYLESQSAEYNQLAELSNDPEI